ncbi:unnamed protein product, partial [Chrysoparadoxa australica]
QVQSRLCKLFPEYTITHQGEAVLGEGVTSLVANAPVHGDSFSWHIDADPMLTPFGPWHDCYGHYSNREPGKPLFVTLLLYLNEAWPDNWEAETQFLDTPTGTGFFVKPRPGRAVLMDQ